MARDDKRRGIGAANRRGTPRVEFGRGLEQMRRPSPPGYLKRGGEPGPLSAQRMGPSQRFEFAPRGYLDGNTGAERRMAKALGVPSGSPTSGIDQYRAQQARAGTDNRGVAMLDARPTRFDPGAKTRKQPRDEYDLGSAARRNIQAVVKPAVNKAKGAAVAGIGAAVGGVQAAENFGRGLIGMAPREEGAQAPVPAQPGAGAVDPRTASLDAAGPAVTPAQAGLAERGGVDGIDAFVDTPSAAAPSPFAGGPAAGFERAREGGGIAYRGPQGSLTYEGPQQGAAGLGGQVRRSSPTGLDAETMQRANETARSGGGGGSLGIYGEYSGPTSTTGMDQAQQAAFEQQRQADIRGNVAGLEAQTAAVREQRNALRAARGEPLVGEQRYTGPAVNRDSGLEAYQARKADWEADGAVPRGLSPGRRADFALGLADLDETRAGRQQEGRQNERAMGIEAFEAQSADQYRRGQNAIGQAQQARGLEQARLDAIKEGFKAQLAADKEEDQVRRAARDDVIERVTDYLAQPPAGAMEGDQLDKLDYGMDFLASAVDAGVSDPARLWGATKVYVDGVLTPEEARAQAIKQVGKPGLFGASEERLSQAAEELRVLSLQQAQQNAMALLRGE
jgi:hypothetical protein